MMKSKKYITLKEAARISGYSPDYIGQLIRQGKLPGKQVFSHVAWVTTEKAIKDYMGKKQNSQNHKGFWSELKPKVIFQKKLSKFYKILLYTIIILIIIFSLLLFYIFAVGIDRTLEQKSLKKAVPPSLLQTSQPSSSQGENGL